MRFRGIGDRSVDRGTGVARDDGGVVGLGGVPGGGVSDTDLVTFVMHPASTRGSTKGFLATGLTIFMVQSSTKVVTIHATTKL